MNKPDGSRQRPRRSRIFLPLLALIVVWSGWTVLQVVRAAGELQEGQRRAVAAQRSVAPDTLRSGAVVEAFARAEEPFRAASARLRHPILAPARVLPVGGRQLRAMAAL